MVLCVPPEQVRQAAQAYVDQHRSVLVASTGLPSPSVTLAASIAAGEPFDDLELLRLHRMLRREVLASGHAQAVGGVDAYRWVSKQVRNLQALTACGLDEPNQDSYLVLHPTQPGVVLGLVKSEGDRLHRWEGSGWSEVPSEYEPAPDWPLIPVTPENQLDVADLVVQMGAHDRWGPVQAYCSECGGEYDPVLASALRASADPAQGAPIFALLDRMEPDSVVEMFSVPAPGQVVAFRDGTWQGAPDLMPVLTSPDAPAVVKLSEQGVANITEAARQTASKTGKKAKPVEEPIVSAAGAATSRMPLKLRKYWLGPKGRAKIRWGTKGSFRRCQKAMSKYMPPNIVNGSCSNLYRQATGRWPGRRGGEK